MELRQVLTGHLQRGVVAAGLPQVVARHAHVAAVVGLAAAAVHDAQEEERAAGQQHALGARAVPVRLHPLPVLVPLHRGGGPALRLAVEGGRLPLGHDEVRGVLGDAGREVLLAQARSWGSEVSMGPLGSMINQWDR